MNKLGNALYEIHHMDMLAAKDQWVNKIHPRSEEHTSELQSH